MQHSSKLLLSLCLCILLVTGCRKDSEDNPVNPGTNKPTVLTTIAGIVSDENGNALSGITVSTHGKTAVSNQYGLFVVKDVRVPQDRCFILARQDGYFTASRAEVPKANGVTNMRLSMMTNPANYSVSASAGGTVNISGGGIIEFPANGFSTESGQPYTGTVKVAARWLNPSSKTFYDFFPGDFTATRTDGSETLLYSYGVLNVELYSTSGAKVKMATGKQATLKYPIPSSMLSGAPSEMPLWYFDEGIGTWKEEGKAVKQGSFYAGEVTHFTPWNCDIPETTAVVRGHVRCDNDNVPNIRVQVGQREVITDENGYYEVRVPAGLEFDISVDPAINLNSGTVTPVSVGPLSNEETFTQDVTVTSCPAYLTGTLTDCNGAPVEGIVQAVGTKGFGYVTVRDGQFRMRVEPNVQLTVNAIDYNGGVGEPLIVESVTSGTTRNVGELQMCPQTAISYIDIPLDSDWYITDVELAVSPDGSLVILSGSTGGDRQQDVYQVQTGKLIKRFNFVYASGLAFSNDGTKLLYPNIFVEGNTWRTPILNTTTWQEIHSLATILNPMFVPDGNSVIGIEPDSRKDIIQLSIATGAEINRFHVSDGKYAVISLIGVRANGTEFIYQTETTNHISRIVVWSMINNTRVREFDLPKSREERIYLSHDGNRLVSYGTDDKLYIYDMNSGNQIGSISFDFGWMTEVGVAPTTGQIAMYSRNTIPQLPPALYDYDINGGMKRRFLPSASGSHFSWFAYSGDGSKLAGVWWSANNNQYIRIWNLR